MDADNATPPDAFQDLVEHIGDAAAIIASRWRKESKVSPRQPASAPGRLPPIQRDGPGALQLKISDTQCGAKLMKREAVQKVMPHLGETRWAFDVDLLFQLRRAGCRIIEWPTTWRDVGGSRLRIVRVSTEMFLAICRLRLLYSPFRWVVTAYDQTIGRVVHLKHET